MILELAPLIFQFPLSAFLWAQYTPLLDMIVFFSKRGMPLRALLFGYQCFETLLFLLETSRHF